MTLLTRMVALVLAAWCVGGLALCRATFRWVEDRPERTLRVVRERQEQAAPLTPDLAS